MSVATVLTAATVIVAGYRFSRTQASWRDTRASRRTARATRRDAQAVHLILGAVLVLTVLFAAAFGAAR